MIVITIRRNRATIMAMFTTKIYTVSQLRYFFIFFLVKIGIELFQSSNQLYIDVDVGNESNSEKRYYVVGFVTFNEQALHSWNYEEYTCKHNKDFENYEHPS